MLASIKINTDELIQVDLSNPIDISIPMEANRDDVSAWYVEPAQIKAVSGEGFLGSVKDGGAVNFRNISFNPHGNCTHTECVGHISETVFSVNKALKTFFFKAELITVEPTIYNGVDTDWRKKGDAIITKEEIQKGLCSDALAIIIRTKPNNKEKLHQQYSNTNWPYLDEAAAHFIREKGIKHILIDLPSVDRENDGGKLLAHRAFWNYPEYTRHDCTITEMIYVDDEVEDGTYLLNLQIASFENDASPSKPVLYKVLQ